MSDKGKLGVNCQGKNALFIEDSKNASILLSGRCTSTPIGTKRLSFSRLDTSIGDFDITPDNRSTPLMDISAVPIFGRQNVQQLNKYRDSGDQSGVMRILKKHNAQHRIVNADQTFDDDKAQPCSSGLFNTKQQSKQSKETKRKLLESKRKSTNNDSRGPVFKTTSKRPKSPRLLTAMRAKLRINRDKIKNLNAEIGKENVKKTIVKKNNVKQIDPSLKFSSATVYSKYKITIPKAPKLGPAKRSCHV